MKLVVIVQIQIQIQIYWNRSPEAKNHNLQQTKKNIKIEYNRQQDNAIGLQTYQSREWVDGSWVMGQMGHENRMGHMGHGSLGVDP